MANPFRRVRSRAGITVRAHVLENRHGLARRVLDRLDIDVLPRWYSSPIPLPGEIDPRVWARESDLLGVVHDWDAALGLLENDLHPYMCEFDPPLTDPGDGGFYLANPFYPSIDAEVLYGMIRHLKPERIIEVGGGFSTFITAAAASRNRAEGSPCTVQSFDPEPRAEVARLHGVESQKARAQDIPLETFKQLGNRDVLFIDSTHVVKPGGDVNTLVLNILPRLSPGVVVHFHDIFLPFEYPEHWVTREHRYWDEQYLLQAFLVGNGSWRVLMPVHALDRLYEDRVRQVIPGSGPPRMAGAFWIERIAA